MGLFKRFARGRRAKRVFRERKKRLELAGAVDKSLPRLKTEKERKNRNAILGIVSRQGTYFPELGKRYNSLLKNSQFYPETNIPVLLGKREIDETLLANSLKMSELGEEIKYARMRATRSHKKEEVDALIDRARELENEYNDLKKANFRICNDFFSA
ncbi:MAG: hypothetical protein JW772_03445, partial [Candidatus Diapherotrites archaeon]|nr:hypothetical protein [Candidatus Diapherotrites archaeon]